jgi:peptidoglycan hydrolase-like protein with peptidoglycan-binding domain
MNTTEGPRYLSTVKEETIVPLSGSVGKSGLNRTADVFRVQEALHIARAQEDMPPIQVDGLVGPQTIGAIEDFQHRHTQVGDGRIDPHGPTLRELETMVGPVIEARIRAVIVRVLEGLASELQMRGLQLPQKSRPTWSALTAPLGGYDWDRFSRGYSPRSITHGTSAPPSN